MLTQFANHKMFQIMFLRSMSTEKWNILSKFPKGFSFCFAYGSGVKKQLGNSTKKPMIDLVFCVIDSREWHHQNLQLNPSHYSGVRFMGHSMISKIQRQFGARIFCNTLIPLDDGSTIKYSVVSTSDLITDLIDWNYLYLAGRLHKPVDNLYSPEADIEHAIAINLTNAVRASLLLLPSLFTYFDLFYTIANLSYAGDFRMIFGESKDKVKNIVTPQLEEFQELYLPILRCFSKHLILPLDTGGHIVQNKSEVVMLHHLKNLPKALRMKAFADREATMIQLSRNPHLPKIIEKSVNNIVWNSSVFQSLKNIPTAGLTKSIRYSWKKTLKTLSY